MYFKSLTFVFLKINIKNGTIKTYPIKTKIYMYVNK